MLSLNLPVQLCKMVLEYCAAGSLCELYDGMLVRGQPTHKIDLGAPFNESQIIFLCREVLKGLQYLHSLGIMHRDIKGVTLIV